MKKILGLMVIGFLALPIQATDNNTLHTFSSGETISSSKMNHNFKYTNSYKVKSNNNIIGELITLNANGLTLASQNGLIFQIDRHGTLKSELTISYIYYNSNDCTGQGYLDYPFMINVLFSYNNNFYYQESDQSVDLNVPSYFVVNGNCQANPNAIKGYAVKINDPNETKILNQFDVPLKIEK